jgi:hypothetical protein
MAEMIVGLIRPMNDEGDLAMTAEKGRSDHGNLHVDAADTFN